MRDKNEALRAFGQDDWVRAAIAASGDVVYDWDIGNDTISWAGQSKLLLGEAGAEFATGAGFNSRVNPEDLPARLKALSDHFADGQPYDCEYRVRGESGAFSWVHDRGTAQFGPDGQPVRMVGMLRLVTDRKQNEARLERLASFDELTGQLNKGRLRDSLDHALSYARRYDVPGAFLVVGVDKLALINNTFGYEIGDAVLIAISQRLDACLRSCDVIGRIGADRFGVILGKCNEEQMTRATERILQIVRDTPIETAEGPLHVTVSIGGLVFPNFSTSAYEVLTKAETSLLQAKKDGRDCFVPYRMSEQQSQEHRRSLDVAGQVSLAMRENRLMFAFQPVVTSVGQQIAFYECLLRLRDQKGEILPAGSFISVVEKLGLMRLVDRYVLDLALRELHEDSTVSLAINISGMTATEQSWLRHLRAALKGKPEIASRLIVEITETAALHDVEESARFVSAVRDLGCRIAVDDFGAGFTSFSHLKALTIDIVKLDGGFVGDVAKNPDNQLFIRNLLGLAEAFNLETVAECVETEAEAAFLTAEGVDYQQGYYYAKPTLHRTGLILPGNSAPVAPLKLRAAG